MLETSQGDDLHQMLTELKRTKQSTFPAYAKGMFTAAEAKWTKHWTYIHCSVHFSLAKIISC